MQTLTEQLRDCRSETDVLALARSMVADCPSGCAKLDSASVTTLGASLGVAWRGGKVSTALESARASVGTIDAALVVLNRLTTDVVEVLDRAAKLGLLC